MTWCLASFLSALTMLGMPAEIYTQGTQLLAVLFFIPVISFVTGEVYMPLFHNLQLDSSYQYLEMRFNKTVSNDKTCRGKYYAHAFHTVHTCSLAIMLIHFRFHLCIALPGLPFVQLDLAWTSTAPPSHHPTTNFLATSRHAKKLTRPT